MPFVTISGVRLARQAYNIMSGFFQRGWAANRVELFMKDLGIGKRRATVQLVRRHVLGIVKKQEATKKLGANVKPSKGHLVEEEWEDDHRYKTYGTQTLFDADTGLEETVPWQVYSYDLPTKESALAKLYEMRILGDSKPGTTLIHAEAIQFQHKRGASY